MEGFAVILPLLGLLLLSGAVVGKQTDREKSLNINFKEEQRRDGDVRPIREEASHEEISHLMRIRKILRDLIEDERVAELARSVVTSPENSGGREARNNEEISAKIEKKAMTGAASAQNTNEATAATSAEETTKAGA